MIAAICATRRRAIVAAVAQELRWFLFAQTSLDLGEARLRV